MYYLPISSLMTIDLYIVLLRRCTVRIKTVQETRLWHLHCSQNQQMNVLETAKVAYFALFESHQRYSTAAMGCDNRQLS